MHINGNRQSDNTFGGEICRRWCAESVFECAGSRAKNKTQHKRKGHTQSTHHTPEGRPWAKKHPMLSPLKTRTLFFYSDFLTCHASAPAMAKAGWQRSVQDSSLPPSLSSRHLLHPCKPKSTQKYPSFYLPQSSYYSYSFRLTNIHEFAPFSRKEKSDLQMLKRCPSNWSRKFQGFEPPSV